jgi:hypothetical protein
MRASRVFVWLYALALIAIGVGSAVYHASLSFAGQTADVAGMYLLGTFILLYNAARAWRIAPQRIVVFYVSLNAALITLLVLKPALRRYLFAALILSAIAIELRGRVSSRGRADTRFFVAALATIVFGFALWTLDFTGTLCAPASLMQGHGVWHLSGAVSAVLLFLYYWSEERAPEPLPAE